jgi:hypothetical protein
LAEGIPWQGLESKPAGVQPVVPETASLDSRAHVAPGVPDSLEGRIPALINSALTAIIP